ncbi:uncharacterized protein LOC105839499 [Monomorium pharaonis]|uniref:uncharacterized protein LOC105839499 n=1 Tax=Monomorium pharaonis TaxID=307658 RepID=UPI00063FD192|nr:uncharacterized protein LOC105839499 [Monomorium pharaonis]
MKLLAVFGLILICYNVSATETSKYANLLETFLIKFKTTMKTGDEKLGIPVLDPFKADRLAIDLKEDTINLNANLTKVNVNGLSEYDIIAANLAFSIVSGTVNLTIHLSWPLVAASTGYGLNAQIQDFELYGNGNMSLSAQEFVFETHIYFVMDENKLNGYLKVDKMILNLSLKSLDFEATGIFDDDELSKIISAVISDMAPRLISDGKITNEIQKLIKQKLDAFLASMTFLEILQLFM